MQVLYVGDMGEVSLSLYRSWALSRLGHTVSTFDTRSYLDSGGRLIRALRYRTLLGSAVARANRLMLEQARDERPDVVVIDKGLLFSARTLQTLNTLGCLTVNCTMDNPFGPRGDPGWRLFRQAVPHYRLHLVQRDSNFGDYRAAGAQDVQMLRTAYEPTIHFPPPEGWSDADRLHDVVFIGTPYDQRGKFMLDLWRDNGIAPRIWGAPKWWSAVLPPDARQALLQGGELWIGDYRETIWRSRFCIAFVTHSNVDEVAQKSFEIAGCGGLLLAEDTPGHRAHFAADEEAVFFSSPADCAEKVRRLLNDEAARTRIAAAGRRRAVESGYSNDARLERVFDYIGRTYFPGR